MSRISDLVCRFLHRLLGASEGTPTLYTASAGTARTAVCAALTQADDYWNGAVCKWESGDNAGYYSTIADFDAATDTLTFDEDLPFAVANADTFRLCQGGKYISDEPMPLLAASSPVLCTGFAIARASARNDTGTGVLTFRVNGGYGAQTLSWTPPGGSAGEEVVVGDLTDGSTVELLGGGTADDAESQCIVVARTAAALPTEDVADDIFLQAPLGIFPPIHGTAYDAGVTLYRAIGLKNEASSPLYNVAAYCPPSFSGAAAAVLTAVLGTGAGTLYADDLASWGTQGWVYNSTKDDLRFVYNRSGNEAAVLAPGAGLRGKAAVAWEIGDDIELYPWIDIGLEAPGGGDALADPSDQHTAPAGVAFTCPTTAAAGLAIGTLAAGAIYCVWARLVIPAGVQPLNAADVRVSLSANPTE